MIKIKIFGYELKKKEKPNLSMGDMWNLKYNYMNSHINQEMYLNFAVSSCFNEILRSFKSLQFGVYKNVKGDYKKSNSSISKKMGKMIKHPNHLCNWNQILESYLTSIYFSGNCLLRKVPSYSNFSNDDLYIYMNNMYNVERNERSLMIEKISIGQEIYSGDELKEFKLVSEFNFRSRLAGTGDGIARTEHLEPIKKLINGTIAYITATVTNGGSMGGILGIDDENNPMSPDEFNEFKKNFMDKYTNPSNAGKPLIVNRKVAYNPTYTVPKDLDYVDSLKELQKIVCRAMGVPETLIIGDNSSYNNSLEFKKKIYTELIIPLAEEFCQHLSYLFRDDLAEDEEFYIDISSIKCLQSSMTQEIQQLVASLMGITTINNVINVLNDKYQLELENLGADGDVVLVPSNFMTLQDIVSSADIDLSQGSNNEEVGL